MISQFISLKKHDCLKTCEYKNAVFLKMALKIITLTEV